MELFESKHDVSSNENAATNSSGRTFFMFSSPSHHISDDRPLTRYIHSTGLAEKEVGLLALVTMELDIEWR